MPAPAGVFVNAGDTMPTMKKLAVVLLALLGFALAAPAQEYSDDPYEFILAKLAADDGRFDEALTRLDKLVQKNPDNAVLRFERAMVMLDASRNDAAEAELRKVVQLQPNFYDAERILGRLLLDRAGSDRAKIDEALTHLQAAFTNHPDDLVTGMAVSQIFMGTGRNAEAEKVLATMIERVPDNRLVNYTYAQVLTKLGRGDEARKYLERAVEVDPTFGQAAMQLVDIYQKSNEFERAAEVLQPLVNEDPNNLDLRRQQALLYLRGGEAEKARVAFGMVVDADPKDTRSQYYLAEALTDLEQYEQADKIYKKLLEKAPDDTDLLASYGLSLIGQKKLDEAAKTFDTLLKQSDVPDNLQVLAKTQLAYIALQRGQYAQVVDAAKPLMVFKDRVNAQAVNIALDALKKQKRYGDALALLQPLLDKYPQDPYVNARYVEMLARSGEKDKAKLAAVAQAKYGVKNTIAVAEAFVQAEQYPEAVALLRDAVRTKPDDIDLQFELGSVLERSGDKATAEKEFLTLLSQHPEHAQTLNYLGYMWAESGVNLERAADMLVKAVAQEPRNGAYVDSLGWVYFRQGKLDLAEKYLTDATKLMPRDATVKEHLGEVLAKRGETTRALSLYRAALNLDPESKDLEKIRSKIAELEKQQQAQKAR
jgi:tetratricopeptide (TPR) repeat protein